MIEYQIKNVARPLIRVAKEITGQISALQLSECEPQLLHKNRHGIADTLHFGLAECCHVFFRLIRTACGSIRLVFSKRLSPAETSALSRCLSLLCFTLHWGWYPGLLPKLALTLSLGNVLLPNSLKEAWKRWHHSTGVASSSILL